MQYFIVCHPFPSSVSGCCSVSNPFLDFISSSSSKNFGFTVCFLFRQSSHFKDAFLIRLFPFHHLPSSFYSSCPFLHLHSFSFPFLRVSSSSIFPSHSSALSLYSHPHSTPSPFKWVKGSRVAVQRCHWLRYSQGDKTDAAQNAVAFPVVFFHTFFPPCVSHFNTLFPKLIPPSPTSFPLPLSSISHFFSLLLPFFILFPRPLSLCFPLFPPRSLPYLRFPCIH